LLGFRFRIPPGSWKFFSWVSRVVKWRSLWQADPSSRGVLATVVCHCVSPRNLKNEAALVRVGQLR
jgi:hypothetical protein